MSGRASESMCTMSSARLEMGTSQAVAKGISKETIKGIFKGINRAPTWVADRVVTKDGRVLVATDKECRTSSNRAAKVAMATRGSMVISRNR